MKKTLVVTIGAVLIFIVLGIWLYLLFFGTPSSPEDVFTNLGLENATVDTTTTLQETNEGENTFSLIGLENGGLQQITTRSVAGFGFIGSSSGKVRYVERGTGHIFEINLSSGTEEKISGTTIPRVVEAVFSKDGSKVAFTIEDGYARDTIVGTVDQPSATTDFVNLPTGAFDPFFVSSSTLLYALTTENGTDGYKLSLQNNQLEERIFSIPLQDVEMIWGENEIYIYNKPSSGLKGSLYKVDQSLSPVVPAAFGFMGGVTPSYYIQTISINGELVSHKIDKNTNNQFNLAITYLPEKCTRGNENSLFLWCASPFEVLSENFIEEWYKGATQSQDMLWYVDIENGEALLQSDFFVESGRIIDVDKMETDLLGQTPVFRNKIDNTLWVYVTDTN